MSRNPHIFGNREPGKRAVRREGSKTRRLLPGERAADCAAAVAQPHRQQLIGLLGEVRTGKAQQQPAGLDPFDDGSFLARRIRSDIRKNQDGELASEKISGVATADLGEWTESALELVVFAEERLGAAIRRYGDADRAASPPLIDQQHRAG